MFGVDECALSQAQAFLPGNTLRFNGPFPARLVSAIRCVGPMPVDVTGDASKSSLPASLGATDVPWQLAFGELGQCD